MFQSPYRLPFSKFIYLGEMFLFFDCQTSTTAKLDDENVWEQKSEKLQTRSKTEMSLLQFLLNKMEINNETCNFGTFFVKIKNH